MKSQITFSTSLKEPNKPLISMSLNSKAYSFPPMIESLYSLSFLVRHPLRMLKLCLAVSNFNLLKSKVSNLSINFVSSFFDLSISVPSRFDSLNNFIQFSFALSMDCIISSQQLSSFNFNSSLLKSTCLFSSSKYSNM